jgi:hypothetical protein
MLYLSLVQIACMRIHAICQNYRYAMGYRKFKVSIMNRFILFSHKFDFRRDLEA